MNFPRLGSPRSARCVAVNPAHPNRLYLGMEFSGIWKYENGAWAALHYSLSNNLFIRFVPSNPNIIFVGSAGNLSKSTDGGASWQTMSLPFIRTLSVDPGNASIVYVGTGLGSLMKSTDGGATWAQMFDKPIGGGIRKIAIDPTSPNTIYVGAAAGGDAFVAKLNPSGSALLFSTYFGGSGLESEFDIALTPLGDPIISGRTFSTDLPTTSLQRNMAGITDSFVTRFNLTTRQIAYSTYLGGSGTDSVHNLAVDASGNAYIVGSTNSTNFPTTRDALFLANNGTCRFPPCTHAFLTKLNASGTGYLYSTLMGGTGVDIATCVAVDSANNAYVAGSTTSRDFHTTPNAFDRMFAGLTGTDAFVSKIAEGVPFITCLKDDANGNVLRYNIRAGEFEFVNCRKGWSVRGQLISSVNGCKTTLTNDARSSVRLNALVNTCTGQGNATVIVEGKSYSIADPDLINSDCNCSP